MSTNIGETRLLPNYTFSEAAFYLGIPVSTVRSWTKGYTYKTRLGLRRFEPPLHPAGMKNGTGPLSFINLVELHVLDAMRRAYRIKMEKIRAAVSCLLQHYRIEHPLARIEFLTDGIDLYMENLGRVESVSARGQLVIREFLALALQRIEWDERGVAARLYPFTRINKESGEPKFIEINPDVAFGRPVLIDTGIPVDVLIDRYKAGDSSASLADDYNCTTDMIEEVLRFTLSHAA